MREAGPGDRSRTSHQNAAAVVRFAGCRRAFAVRGTLLGGTGADRRRSRDVLEPSAASPGALQLHPGLCLLPGPPGSRGLGQQHGAPARLGPSIAHPCGRRAGIQHQEGERRGERGGKTRRERGGERGGGEGSPPTPSPDPFSAPLQPPWGSAPWQSRRHRAPAHTHGRRPAGRFSHLSAAEPALSHPRGGGGAGI